VRGRLLRRSDLSPSDEDLMFSLFRKHFEGVPREQFQIDLDQKNWIVLLDGEREGLLEGFSSIHYHHGRHRGAPLGVVFSGDTIVDRAAWGRSALAPFWIGAVNHLHRTEGKGRLYWFLLVSGYRTYRYLPVFWREFHPRFDAPTPPDVQELIDLVAAERFGACYRRDEGLVRLPVPEILREDLRGIPNGRNADPHVAFFARRNPGHERGDELACLTEIAWDNLTAAGRRVWTEGDRVFAARERNP
jgi:hypothetical protein